MAKDKKNESPATSEEVNSLMEFYRNTALPTPVLLWRTEGKTVAAAELSDAEFDEVMAVLQP